MKKPPKLTRLLLSVQLAATLEALIGCHTRTAVITRNPPSSIQQEQAVSIAQQEARRHGWDELEIGNIRYARGAWLVLVRQVPAVPGGHALVEISPDGTVVHFVAGK